MSDHDVTAHILAVIAACGRRKTTVKQLSAISSTRWQHRMIDGEWRYSDLVEIAKVLRVPVERLTSVS